MVGGGVVFWVVGSNWKFLDVWCGDPGSPEAMAGQGSACGEVVFGSEIDVKMGKRNRLSLVSQIISCFSAFGWV